MKSIREFLAQRPDGPIYHYTDAQGLLGIFEGKEIWASDALHLNDAKEFLHAQDILREVFQERIEEATRSSEEKTLYRKALEMSWSPDGLMHSHVASFSANGDQLSQWRAYCARGNGFSIGFALADLKFALAHSGFRPVKCVYDPKEQRDLIEALCDYSIRGWRKAKKLREADELRDPAKRTGLHVRLEIKLVESYYATMCAIKHPSFKEEDEWRLVGPERSAKFRQGKFGIVPYSIIPLCDSGGKPSFARIYVGPNAEPKLQKEAVRLFLGAHAQLGSGISGMMSDTGDKVLNSQVPYRY